MESTKRNQKCGRGPMKGLVTLDPFFSKKQKTEDNNYEPFDNNPKCKPKDHKDGNSGAGPRADIISVKECHIQAAKVNDESRDEAFKTGIAVIKLPCNLCDRQEEGEPIRDWTGDAIREIKDPAMQNELGHVFFSCQENVVMWKTVKSEGPVWVWAYKGEGDQKNPVTGDYDLWMVAPHVSSDEVDQDDGLSMTQSNVTGGVATMTPFIRHWITNTEDNLNKLMGHPWGKDGMQVFNHGAEQQNYYFVQDLDKRLTVVLPRNDFLKDICPLNNCHDFRAFNEKDPHHDTVLNVQIYDTHNDDTLFEELLMRIMARGYVAPPHPAYSVSQERIEKEKRRMTIECINTAGLPPPGVRCADAVEYHAKLSYFHKHAEKLWTLLDKKVEQISAIYKEYQVWLTTLVHRIHMANYNQTKIGQVEQKLNLQLKNKQLIARLHGTWVHSEWYFEE